LVERLKRGQPLARFDRKTLYTPGPGGYSDYPTYQATAQEVTQ
jgi:N-ethylmaleimide reductase